MDAEFRARFAEHINRNSNRPDFEHDPQFILMVFDTIVHDLEAIDLQQCPSEEIFLCIGFCWHWLRPHQTRWTADGGFAWPAGYKNGMNRSHLELPELSSSFVFLWNRSENTWHKMKQTCPLDKRDLVLRVALPGRTHRHNQAAVHTLLGPGTASRMNHGAATFYGFRKLKDGWQCTATDGFGRGGWHRFIEPCENRLSP